MNLFKLIFSYFYFPIIQEIVNTKKKTKSVINKFCDNLKTINLIYFISIILFVMIISFCSLILIPINKKKKNNLIINIIKKIPFLKNISNFILANLLMNIDKNNANY